MRLHRGLPKGVSLSLWGEGCCVSSKINKLYFIFILIYILLFIFYIPFQGFFHSHILVGGLGEGLKP